MAVTADGDPGLWPVMSEATDQAERFGIDEWLAA
jgi:hypothetical protein